MGLDIFEIYVTIDTNVVQLGTCDADHISRIVLLHALFEKQTGSDKVPEDDYSVWVYLPWSSEKKEVCTDSDLLEVFRCFTEHKQTKIMFEIEKRHYIPAAVEFDVSSSTPSRFIGDIPAPQDFMEFVEDLFGDNEDQVRLGDDYGDDSGDDSGDDESPCVRDGDDESSGPSGPSGMTALAVVPEVPEQVCEDIEEFDDLFEGYQSRSDDEYCSDSGDEVSDARLARVVKSNPFKQLVGCPIRFEVGQTHDSVYSLRSLLTDFAIHEGFNLNKIKNDKNRLTWACMAKGCPWRIHASNVGDDTTMQVKTYRNEHTCHRIYKSKEARSKWIAGKFQALVKSNPGIQANVISDLLRDQFNVVVDTQRLYKAKKRAVEVLLKEHQECFKHLRSYALMVQQCNPGSAAYIHLLEKSSTFQRMFVSFDAQRRGFLEGCRPFIGIDGCHLKGPYGGVLLSAIALDANSGLYPLAYCICEGETFLSWSWFLEQLRVFLRYPDEKPICFMSDRQKGVIGALKMQWPRASIRFCARHIYANFRVSYGGQKLKNLFWKAAKTADRFEFKKILADIGGINPKALKYLAEIEPCHWSRHAFDASIKCESVTNNMTEAFNSMLKDFRPRTYLQLMEFIRRLVMSRFQLRKDECNTWKTDIPPSVNTKILENSEESRILKTLHSGGGKYEMLGVGRAYTANLVEKTCECGQWQVSGVPCSHALAGIRYHFGVHGDQNNLAEFIDPMLSKFAYLRTYSSMIHPIPDLCVWADLGTTHVDAPPLKRLPGRPRLVRKRESGEKQKAAKTGTVVCGNCKQPGHNSRSCKSESTSGSTKKQKVPNKTNVSVSSSQSSQSQGVATSSQPPTKRQRAKQGKGDVGSSQPTEVQNQTQAKSQLTQNLNCGNSFGKLPDHLLIEIFIRIPVSEWPQISCVKKQWANLFRGECLWQAALNRTFPLAVQAKRWPGPIPRGLSRRRYRALHVSKHVFALDGEIDEIVGHTYLFLKEQLELSTMPPPSGVLHGTIIDQFIACGKSKDIAHELASLIWQAVLDNLEENERTFLLLKRLALEGDVFLPFPYSRSNKVQWRVFEKLFTDFRDCFNHVDYYDLLACAKNKFQPIPPTWLGY